MDNAALPINCPTPEIARWHNRWRTNRDFIAGKDAVKARGECYLPKIRVDDGPEHYKRHLMSTCFYPATAKIAMGIEGLIFRKPEQFVTTSDRVALLSRSITPRNRSLTELAREFTREKMTTYFTGLLVDHPPRDQFKNLNAANADRLGYRPRVSLYRAESILEVTEGPVGQNHQLVHVRLLEEDGTRVRQLLINDDGFYEQRIYKADDGGQFDKNRFERSIPTINGQPLTEIPFFLDSKDGSPCPSPSLLESTADMNLDHYLLSGLLANMTWQTSGPIVFVSNFQREKDANGDEIDPMWDIGPNVVIEMKGDAQPHYFTFDPKNAELLTKQLADLKTDLSTLGHSILAPEKAAPEAVETILLRRVAENATLAGFAAEASTSLEKAVKLFARWVDGSDVQFSLNSDFTPAGISPAEHKELRDDYLNGTITLETYLQALKDGEVLPSTLDPAAEAERAQSQVADRPAFGL